MNTLQTTDYSIFNDISSNREVDERHVRRLVIAIEKKNLLHLNPLLCNSNMDVIDGQHRLEAARRLQVPVYYVVDGSIGKADIASINSNSKNWSVMDYVNFWTVEKRPGFDLFSRFLVEHPGIPVSTALMLMSEDGKRDTESLRNGSINVTNYDQAVSVAGVVKYFRNYIDFAYDRNFISAVASISCHPEYDHERMKLKVEGQPRSLVKCINVKQYKDMLLEIYNYNVSKNKLVL